MTNESVHLSVLMSGGSHAAYEQLLREFKRTSGIEVTTGSGASQGAGPQTIPGQKTAAKSNAKSNAAKQGARARSGASYGA
jgi:hypothetical protein